MTGLEQMEEHPVESQVGKLAKAIQQLQQRVVELELQVGQAHCSKCETKGKKLPEAQSRELRH
jgi:hypothetical protein